MLAAVMTRAGAALAGVLLVAGLLYFRDLGRAPVYIGWDEVRTALQGYSLARTGRDMTGARLPIFFHITDPLIPNNSTPIWWQPTLFYLTAAVLKVAPLDQWSVRVPNVCLGLLNILLIALAAQRLFGNRWYGVAAAALLALTPAHFFFARLAQDYFLSQTYVLLWLCLLLAFLETRRSWLPIPIGLVLALGVYTHISSWIIMPFYLGVTVLVFLAARLPLASQLRLLAGFALGMLPLAAFLWVQPSLIRDMFLNYKPVTSPNLAERVTLYWDYFNPSYLFFSGGADPMWATRKAGVFLLPIAVLLPCGIIGQLRRGLTIPRALLLVGFAFAPVPIVLALPEAPQYATARDLLVIPFGILLSVAGIRWLVESGGRGRIAVTALLLAVPLQFVGFSRDYFGDYQHRSSFRHDGLNMRGVVDAVIEAERSGQATAIYLSEDLGTGKSVQWQYHLTTRQRLDLWEKSAYFDPASFTSARGAISAGSLVIIAPNHARLPDILRRGTCTVVQQVHDVAGTPSAAILRCR